MKRQFTIYWDIADGISFKDTLDRYNQGPIKVIDIKVIGWAKAYFRVPTGQNPGYAATEAIFFMEETT